MSEIQIDKNIPMPKRDSGGRPRKYPFDKLTIVGMSFGVPCIPADADKKVGTIRSAAIRWAQRVGSKRKFVVQYRDEDEHGSQIEPEVRCWLASTRA